MSDKGFFQSAVEESEPLTREEEGALGRDILRGDIAAQNKLVEANLKFVPYIVKRYYNITHRLDYDDVLSSGYEGLVEAAKRFDYRKGCRFSTYARHWIKKKINQYIYQQAPIAKVPPVQIKVIHRLHHLAQQLQRSICDKELSDEEVACDVGISLDLVHDVKAAFRGLSIDDEESHCPISGEVGYSANPAIIKKAYYWIQELPAMESDIILRYYGVNCAPQTLQDISSIYILSRERIRQIKREALDKVCERLERGALPSPQPEELS